MDFDKRPHGIDFGRWTQWQPPDDPPKPLDFIIAGITSGDYAVQTFEANKIYIAAEERLMTYHFFEPISWNSRATPQKQADIYSKYADMVGPKALAVDWENTSYFTLGKGDVFNFISMIEILQMRYPRVFMYSNISDFEELIVKYAPEFAKDIDLWIAYPPKSEYSEWKNWPIYSEARLGRSWDSVSFLQYSWWGDGEAYGVVGGSPVYMDLNYYQGTMEELDAWLGIQPSEDDDMSDEKLDQILAKLDEINTSIKNYGTTILLQLDAEIPDDIDDDGDTDTDTGGDDTTDDDTTDDGELQPGTPEFEAKYKYAYKPTDGKKAPFYLPDYQDNGKAKFNEYSSRIAWNNEVKYLAYFTLEGGYWVPSWTAAGLDELSRMPADAPLRTVKLASRIENTASDEKYHKDIRLVEFDGKKGFVFVTATKVYKNGLKEIL